MLFRSKVEETDESENLAPAKTTDNKPAEDEKTAETEPEKKKKGLFSRLFSR